MVRKLVHRHLLSNPLTDYRVLHAPVQVSGGRVYLDTRISDQLWAAIRQDAITAFAEKYPFTVTPAAPR